MCIRDRCIKINKHFFNRGYIFGSTKIGNCMYFDSLDVYKRQLYYSAMNTFLKLLLLSHFNISSFHFLWFLSFSVYLSNPCISLFSVSVSLLYFYFTYANNVWASLCRLWLRQLEVVTHNKLYNNELSCLLYTSRCV